MQANCSTDVSFTGAHRTFKKKPLLKLLGVPFDARWEAVAPLVKRRIVAARLANDTDAAASWSQAKIFLRHNLTRVCGYRGCTSIIRGKQVGCCLCRVLKSKGKRRNVENPN